MIGTFFGHARANGIFTRNLPLAMIVSITLAPTTITLASSRRHDKPLTGVPNISSIALFPSDNAAGATGQAAADGLEAVLSKKLAGQSVYETTRFSPLLPSIQRALSVDNTLSQKDITPPINDPATAQRIAQVMGTDGYILEEVDAFKQDPTTNAVTVTVSGSLYLTSSGSASRAFAVTGTAVPLAQDEGSAITTQRAIANASTEIANSLGALPSAEKGKRSDLPTTKKRNNAIGTAVLAALGIGLISIIVNNTHHNDNGGSSSSSSGSTGGGSGLPGLPPI